MNTTVNRRVFLAGVLGAAAYGTVVGSTARAAEQKTGPWVCAFSKHLQFLEYKELAKTGRDVGLDGFDLTVRSKGHVEPKNVAIDLPAAVEAIRAEGLDVYMITTNLNKGSDPDARPILEAASKLGIRYFRIGGLMYDMEGPILPQLEKFTGGLRELAKVAEEFKMTAGYHNHSGFLNVGGTVWDLFRMLETIHSPNLGSNFDIAHATVEGGYGDWQTTSRLMAPLVKMMAVKDFVWDKDKPKWVPLGEGVTPTAAVLKIMRGAGFQGPVSMHFEYKIKSNDAMIEEVRRSAQTLRGYLSEAGYA